METLNGSDNFGLWRKEIDFGVSSPSSSDLNISPLSSDLDSSFVTAKENKKRVGSGRVLKEIGKDLVFLRRQSTQSPVLKTDLSGRVLETSSGSGSVLIFRFPRVKNPEESSESSESKEGRAFQLRTVHRRGSDGELKEERCPLPHVLWPQETMGEERDLSNGGYLRGANCRIRGVRMKKGRI